MQNESSHSIVYCLTVDMVGSTLAGLNLTSEQLDKFNNALMEQIRPHLERLKLDKELLKFTGDGWLLMTTNTDKLKHLCCLAIILSKRFTEEMSQLSGLPPKRIPSLRIAICSGNDMQVDLPNGGRDWAGDSARRATRVCAWCKDNEILVDDPVKSIINRDFDVSRVDLKTRERDCCKPSKLDEEELNVYALKGIKENVSKESHVDCYVYTLGVIGKQETANMISEAMERSIVEFMKGQAPEKKSLQDEVILQWNKILESQVDYEKLIKFFKAMLSENIKPNIDSYRALIQQSPDYTTSENWFKSMLSAGLKSNREIMTIMVFKASTYEELKSLGKLISSINEKPQELYYRKLIKKSPSEKEAEKVINEMRIIGVKASIRTYEAMYRRLSDFSRIRVIWARMRKSKVAPTINTYNIVLSKAPDYETAKAVYTSIKLMELSPNTITFSIMSQLAPDAKIKEQWEKRREEMERDKI